MKIADNQLDVVKFVREHNGEINSNDTVVVHDGKKKRFFGLIDLRFTNTSRISI